LSGFPSELPSPTRGRGQNNVDLARFQSYDLATTAPTTTTTASWSTPGVVIGEGFECEIIPQWTARIEMDMFFFDTTNVTFATTGGPPPFIQTVNSHSVVVKLGLSYKVF
jgi:hypothetical protein